MTPQQFLAGPTNARAADLDAVVGNAVGAGFSVSAKATNTITTTVTLQDANGVAITSACEVVAWISDAAGGALTATDPTSNTVVAGTGAVTLQTVGSTHFSLIQAVAGPSGVFTIAVTQTVSHNYFLNVVLPNGKIVSSPVLAF